MLLIHSNSTIETIDITTTVVSIYDLKKIIATQKKLPIDEIHILKDISTNDCYENSYNISSDSSVGLKLVKNRCQVCLKKSATIVGDCKFCDCKYCLTHRLPEIHKCPGLIDCKKESFDKNYKTVISQKCVASQI